MQQAWLIPIQSDFILEWSHTLASAMRVCFPCGHGARILALSCTRGQGYKQHCLVSRSCVCADLLDFASCTPVLVPMMGTCAHVANLPKQLALRFACMWCSLAVLAC